MEQLIIIILIVLVTGGESFVRWLRKRDAAQKATAARGGHPAAYEEEEVEEEPWFEVLEEEQEKFEPRIHFSKPVIVRVPPPAEPSWFTATALSPPPAAKAVLPAVARPTGARRPGIPARDWIRSPRDARRGIVLMTILGTPRGLE